MSCRHLLANDSIVVILHPGGKKKKKEEMLKIASVATSLG